MLRRKRIEIQAYHYQPSRMRKLFQAAVFLLYGATLSPAESYTVYLPVGTEASAVEEALKPLRKAVPNAVCSFIHLSDKCKTMQEAVQAAKAIRAGVSHLPCLVLADEEGEYAAIPLANLTDESLFAAQGIAKEETRESKAAIRRFQAKEYLLFARLGIAQPLSNEVIELCIVSCRTLMSHSIATARDRQLLGFRCLYPLLMLQYTNSYNGAHTPDSEAKLLEAIAALEAARDLNPDSDIGRAAYAEREKLRAARRKARQYE